ncbi:uncharacterized protein LOC132553648 [Ylistrum balloti]|uniref:uncharacterized protein LOC132553648 n=1 Tax=Ylistrum balloti TaxID=509963 RepID=UPI002905C30F|nr:uncharacterized protein LOC132553648 [Ylistrum balloti]
MHGLELFVLFFFGPIFIKAQFNNMISQMMSGGTGSGSSTTGSDGCAGARVSCLPAPWCRRTTDNRGCSKCECGKQGNTQDSDDKSPFLPNHNQQMTPQSYSSFLNMLSGANAQGFGPNSGAGLMSMGGINPGFGGSQVGPMNPMASMFGANSMYGGGLSGSMGSAGGHNPPNTDGTGSDCGPAPYTCMAPPPWCQRLYDSQGCVNCYCGQELSKFLQALNGITDKPEMTSKAYDSSDSTLETSTGTTLSTLLRSTKTVAMTTAQPPFGKPCLANFMCALSCDTGYQTDDDACPVCACMDDNDKTTIMDPSTTPLQSTGMVLCPGIFDCDTVCMTGYQTDANGCPICQCEND